MKKYKKGEKMSLNKIIVLNFGGQTDQLIVRRVRELGVYAELHPCDVDIDSLDLEDLAGIILTGGPQSVNDKNSLRADSKIFELGVPILGICYGLQYINNYYGGEIETPKNGEYGKTPLLVDNKSEIFKNLPQESTIWMNHRDRVSKLADGFKKTAWTLNCPVAGMENKDKDIYAVQFHPEVVHSEYGKIMIANFVLNICKAEQTWKMDDYAKKMIEEIKEKYTGEKMICALSGGVDSSVAATIVSKAIGDNLQCIFVDHGLLRKNEADEVMATYKNLGLRVKKVDAAKEFLDLLKGVDDPETNSNIS